MIFYQLEWIYRNHKAVVKNATRRASYEIFKSNFDENINLLGSTWKNICVKEEKGN